MNTVSQQDMAAIRAKNYMFRVCRLQNGYTFHKTASPCDNSFDPVYCSDIPEILKEVARAIGGEDAVPIDPVSPEEAGLFDYDAVHGVNNTVSNATDATNTRSSRYRYLMESLCLELRHATHYGLISRISGLLRSYGFSSLAYYRGMSGDIMEEIHEKLYLEIQKIKSEYK
jgi:hypothetical protein